MRLSPLELSKVHPVASSFEKTVFFVEGSKADLLRELSDVSIDIVLQGKGFIFPKFCKF